jgi:hypothetical protein
LFWKGHLATAVNANFDGTETAAALKKRYVFAEGDSAAIPGRVPGSDIDILDI